MAILNSSMMLSSYFRMFFGAPRGKQFQSCHRFFQCHQKIHRINMPTILQSQSMLLSSLSWPSSHIQPSSNIIVSHTRRYFHSLSSCHFLYSSVKVPTIDLDFIVASGDPSTSTIPNTGKPQTAWERIKNFPKGVKALLKDCIRYKNIHDASKTPHNAWTIANKHHVRGFFVYENEIRPGRIPRRQYEQQRQLKQDFRIMLPLVLIWIPPIIGFLPPILATLAPRQVMSRQFNNDYEILWFSEIEYNQRQRFFIELGDLFWNSDQKQQPMLDEERKKYFKNCLQDPAGPIIDGMILYSAFCSDCTEGQSKLELPHGVYTNIRELPRKYLVTLCLSIGVFQQLPLWMSKWMVTFAPSTMLWRQVERIGEIICHDDALLLEERHDLCNCESLTDLEVTDACLMRGLPVSMKDPVSLRRECLTNHLKMITHVKRHIHESVNDGFKLFTVQLAALRYHLNIVDDKQSIRDVNKS